MRNIGFTIVKDIWNHLVMEMWAHLEVNFFWHLRRILRPPLSLDLLIGSWSHASRTNRYYRKAIILTNSCIINLAHLEFGLNMHPFAALILKPIHNGMPVNFYRLLECHQRFSRNGFPIFRYVVTIFHTEFIRVFTCAHRLVLFHGVRIPTNC